MFTTGRAVGNCTPLADGSKVLNKLDVGEKILQLSYFLLLQ